MISPTHLGGDRFCS